MQVIADHPTAEMYASGLEIDAQCARCGSSCEWVDCWAGCEDGYRSDDEYDWPCDECHGRGGWQHCISSAEWCEANPLPGREDVRRGAIEWFTSGEPGGPAGGR
jgi:hypothetical protein